MIIAPTVELRQQLNAFLKGIGESGWNFKCLLQVYEFCLHSTEMIGLK